MRMWMIPPSWLCRKHLLGEHLEVHMLAGTIIKGKSIEGYIRNGLIEPYYIVQRHHELMFEMNRRGYKHNSPFPSEGVYGEMFKQASEFAQPIVDTRKSIEDLKERCPDCWTRIKYHHAANGIPLSEELGG